MISAAACRAWRPLPGIGKSIAHLRMYGIGITSRLFIRGMVKQRGKRENDNAIREYRKAVQRRPGRYGQEDEQGTTRGNTEGLCPARR